jgi:hypothetical protein
MRKKKKDPSNSPDFDFWNRNLPDFYNRCQQGSQKYKRILYTLFSSISGLLSNLAKSSYGWLPVWLHDKMDLKKTLWATDPSDASSCIVRKRSLLQRKHGMLLFLGSPAALSSSLIIESQNWHLQICSMGCFQALMHPHWWAELAVLGFCSCRQKNPKHPKFHCGDNLFWIIF